MSTKRRTSSTLRFLFAVALAWTLTGSLRAGNAPPKPGGGSSPQLSLANNPKISPDLWSAPLTATVRVIVQFTGPHGKSDIQALSRHGMRQHRNFRVIPGIAAELPVSVLPYIAQIPRVKYISLDRKNRVLSDGFDMASVGANLALAAQYGWNGTGIGVAVIDSGVTDSADLHDSNGNSRVVYSESFVPSDTTTSDAYGHGTHVAGLIAGNGANSTCATCTAKFTGTAPNVQIINLRVLDGNGQAADSAIVTAIQRAITLKSAYNIRVINLSLGHPVYESYTLDPLCQAVESAWQAGIVVVVAAGNNGRDNSLGNNGYATITVPGNDPSVITVGAMKMLETDTRADDLVATYSSKGPTALDHVVKPDIVAPGNRSVSVLAPNSTLVNALPGNVVPVTAYAGTQALATSAYFQLSGTSMASPVVAGAAALLLQQDPTLTPDQAKARLMKTASKVFPISSSVYDPISAITYVDYYDIFTIGAGYLDVWAALSDNEKPTAPATSPSVALDALGNCNLVLAPGSEFSADAINWGPTQVWGTSVLNPSSSPTSGATSSTTAMSVVWGTSANAASSVVWGTSIVWGTLNGLDDAMSSTAVAHGE